MHKNVFFSHKEIFISSTFALLSVFQEGVVGDKKEKKCYLSNIDA